MAESIISHMLTSTLPAPSQIDIVVDNYPEISNKGTERERHTHTLQRRVVISSATQKAPPEWKNFLSHPTNKQDLPEFPLRE